MNEQRAAAALAQLQALKRDYRNRTRAIIESLAVLVAADSEGSALAEAEAQLHKLAGSGGSFGFAELSRQARALEQQVRALRHPPAESFDAADLARRIGGLVELLGPDPEPAASAPSARNEPSLVSRILLLEPDLPEAERITGTLLQFGHQVHSCSTPSEAALVLSRLDPDALLVDLDLGGDDSEALRKLFDAVADLRIAFNLRDCALYYISRRDSMALRLAAARSGASAFFVKPVDPMHVIERLELLRQRRNAPRYRVMLVDDDSLLVRRYAAVLEGGGFDVAAIEDPLQALQTMASFRPDLLLLDLYMPGCSGPELARVIRMQDEWLALPIVFLSAETDLGLQISAASEGADDFLTKPIPDAQLIAAVRSRCERAHQMTTLINRDSLTGLLKHARIKEELQAELQRAERMGHELAVAMLDIDHFKRVNDHYGHPVGDQVIRALANLLRQRVRSSDRVGRYGGEEFMLVLGNCSEAGAVKLLSDICARFKALHFQTAQGEFSVTLSAGVASTERFRTAQQLTAYADQALYLAKRTGRDRIETAPAV